MAKEFSAIISGAHSLAALVRRLAALDLTRAWVVTVGQRRPNRTLAQNARYWGVVLRHAAEASGHTVDELHETCKGEILGMERIECLGRVTERPRSTARLDTAEFAAYAQRAEAWLVSELDLRLPAYGY